MNLIEILEELGNKKILILKYILENVDNNENILVKTQREIADILNISTKTVNETFKFLENVKVIERKAGVIIVSLKLINYWKLLNEFDNEEKIKISNTKIKDCYIDYSKIDDIIRKVHDDKRLNIKSREDIIEQNLLKYKDKLIKCDFNKEFVLYLLKNEILDYFFIEFIGILRNNEIILDCFFSVAIDCKNEMNKEEKINISKITIALIRVYKENELINNVISMVCEILDSDLYNKMEVNEDNKNSIKSLIGLILIYLYDLENIVILNTELYIKKLNTLLGIWEVNITIHNMCYIYDYIIKMVGEIYIDNSIVLLSKDKNMIYKEILEDFFVIIMNDNDIENKNKNNFLNVKYAICIILNSFEPEYIKKILSTYNVDINICKKYILDIKDKYDIEKLYNIIDNDFKFK